MSKDKDKIQVVQNKASVDWSVGRQAERRRQAATAALPSLLTHNLHLLKSYTIDSVITLAVGQAIKAADILEEELSHKPGKD